MNLIIKYFTTAPDFHRVILLGITIFIFWNVETLFAINENYKKWRHALLNCLFMVPAMPIQFLFGLIIVKTISWDTYHHWGIINWLPGLSNPIVQLITTFILLDFLEYVYHRIMHRVKPLWIFHLVHHSDNVVDASTTLREHPGETFVRLSFLTLWVFISGTCFWIFLIRQFIQIAVNVFTHSNFRISDSIDKIVGLIFITPNIHHVHHHYKLPYTDSNYGDILSIWDRVFGTFQRLSKYEVKFGIDSYMDEQEIASFEKLFKIPFKEEASSIFINKAER